MVHIHYNKWIDIRAERVELNAQRVFAPAFWVLTRRAEFQLGGMGCRG
jgi:hypothetical protein